MRVRHLILDRDGVLNVEAGEHGYITGPEQWRWVPGALEALVQLHRNGVRISVATNQSGVGRGLMTMADLEAVHARMTNEVSRAGGRISAIHVCPHSPDDHCNCRKPASGLILAAVAQSGIDREETLVVGDDLRDLAAAEGAGVRAALVLTGKGRKSVTQLPDANTAVYDDLAGLARALAAASGVARDKSR